jgi:large subunit ribosomal protein L25
MTKTIHSVSANIRQVFGSQVNALRRSGFTPATIYGHEFEPLSIQFNSQEINRLFDEVGESTLVEIKIGDDKYPVLFKNPQYHPVTSFLVHLDCHKVNLKEKIVATIPLEFIGESLAVKNGNVLVSIIDEIEVEALPTDLPEKIEVDITCLIEIDQNITVADLNLDRSKVEVKNAADQLVVKIEAPKVEEEPVVEAEVTPGDVPATAQKTEEEKAAAEAAQKEEEK